MKRKEREEREAELEAEARAEAAAEYIMECCCPDCGAHEDDCECGATEAALNRP